MFLRTSLEIVFILGFACAYFISPLSLYHFNAPGDTRTVYIEREGDHFELYRHGEPFKIKGASGLGNLDKLAALGANTIRIYDTVDLGAILDEAQMNGLAVIVDIPLIAYDEDYNTYSNPDENDKLISQILALVDHHKSHPALLFWNIGNEVAFPTTFFGNSFTRFYKSLIDQIRQLDPNHPIGTSVVFSSKKELLNMAIQSLKLDYIGFNVFGNNRNMDKELSRINMFLTPFPFYVSEWSLNGPWEELKTTWGAPIEPTSTKKMEQIRARFDLLKGQSKEQNLGSMAFYWGHKLEATPTWFSIFLENDLSSEVTRTFENLWKGASDSVMPIGLNYMLLDGEGAPSSLVLAPGEIKKANLVFHDYRKDSLEIHWELFKEAWDTREWGINGKVLSVDDSLYQTSGDSISLKVPNAEGPYRIFAYACDKEGYCATTNIPFYVLNP